MIEVSSEDGPIGLMEGYGLSTPGRHDGWFGGGPETMPYGLITAIVYLDGVEHDRDERVCRIPETTTTTSEPPATTTTIPVCYDHDGDGVKTYQEDTGDHKKGDICELVNTGFEVSDMFILALILFGLGVVSLAGKRLLVR